MQMVSEVGDVSNRDSCHNEKFPVRLAKPSSELSKVVLDRTTGVRREVVTCKVMCHEGRLLGSDKQPFENIIVPIAALFRTEIRHHVDTSLLELA
jgi:hypothetical protein